MATEISEAALPSTDPILTEESAAPKRKASPSPELEDVSSKRPRRDSALSERVNGLPYDDPDRRKSVTKEEKKRGMRLFGGLLNTLSQTTSTTTQQKRRLEVEKRQQERAHKQRVEGDKRRQEKLARITEIRRQEQIFFDEKVMKLRHANMLAVAHSLRTRAEPPIYYRPYELTQEQQDTVDEQIEEAKRTISREVEEFEARLGDRSRPHGASRPSTAKGETAAAQGDADSPAATPHPTNDQPAPHNSRSSLDKVQRDEDDVVVDADEDMVIY